MSCPSTRRLRELGFKLLLQIHDEVILEGKQKEETSEVYVWSCLFSFREKRSDHFSKTGSGQARDKQKERTQKKKMLSLEQGRPSMQKRRLKS